ncbi:MAG: endonuclease/exonuclease/phosphatase family protein [Ignavibacteriae bacterium]|nr:endonuclease/exonuclease/phosphatase family protein [Ignavibacteriota bacterium]MCB9217698.1 endonuclease/exonuclease/phosphatase family protein [Ignavibacteria bacterium]
MNLLIIIASAIFFVACQSAERGQIQENDLSPINPDAEVLTVAFYNVENLFDTSDDPATADEDFTPTGKMKWTEGRLEEKLENLARAIRAMNQNNGPDILGLCEVENRFVLERLVNEFLPEGVYDIVHTDSPDGRGIDVALLYRKSEMIFERATLHSVPLPSNERPTRGILEVTFEKGGQYFTVLVNHWPSRSGGEQESEPRRISAATTAAAVIDSLTQLNPSADIIMVGDFNDEPSNHSIRDKLKGIEYVAGEVFEGRMINLASPLTGVDTIGTYLYQDDWEIIDQILVSPGALDNKGIVLRDRAMTIFHPEFLRDYHPSQPLNPPRHTYVRRSLYIGGTSDHFPVYVQLGWRR